MKITNKRIFSADHCGRFSSTVFIDRCCERDVQYAFWFLCRVLGAVAGSQHASKHSKYLERKQKPARVRDRSWHFTQKFGAFWCLKESWTIFMEAGT